jgi:hypothetical protein
LAFFYLLCIFDPVIGFAGLFSPGLIVPFFYFHPETPSPHVSGGPFNQYSSISRFVPNYSSVGGTSPHRVSLVLEHKVGFHASKKIAGEADACSFDSHSHFDFFITRSGFWGSY